MNAPTEASQSLFNQRFDAPVRVLLQQPAPSQCPPVSSAAWRRVASSILGIRAGRGQPARGGRVNVQIKRSRAIVSMRRSGRRPALEGQRLRPSAATHRLPGALVRPWPALLCCSQPAHPAPTESPPAAAAAAAHWVWCAACGVHANGGAVQVASALLGNGWGGMEWGGGCKVRGEAWAEGGGMWNAWRVGAETLQQLHHAE